VHLCQQDFTDVLCALTRNESMMQRLTVIRTASYYLFQLFRSNFKIAYLILIFKIAYLMLPVTSCSFIGALFFIKCFNWRLKGEHSFCKLD
jgi:hypothetical protein